MFGKKKTYDVSVYCRNQRKWLHVKVDFGKPESVALEQSCLDCGGQLLDHREQLGDFG